MADQQEVRATDEKAPETPEQQDAPADDSEVADETSEQPPIEMRAAVLTGGDANSDIGTPIKVCGMGEFAEKIQAKRAGNQKYSGGIQHNVTPVSTATQNVSRSETLLAGRQASPSETLLELFSSCSCDPKEKIEEWVRKMGRLFCKRYTQPTDFARRQLWLGEGRYFKLLEKILLAEREKKPDLDLTNLLEQEMFHQALFACCLEIEIHSYNSQRTFPWVLEALNLGPYYFYRVIEVIVKVEDQLSQDMVKHLNMIEKEILVSLAWCSDSLLWKNIHESGLPVPSCEDVCLPGQLDDTVSTVPCSNPVIRRITTVLDSTVPAENPPQSPVPSVSERFQSPQLGSSVAKKRLSGTGSAIIQAQPIGTLEQPQPSTSQQPSANKDKEPKRTGSLGLFFRKFYLIASVRMQELCLHLNLKDVELKQKIWTCFEHTIIHHTDLMQDRHLDQILMCSVYIICKRVAKFTKEFAEIVECYRHQHPTQSHIYRSVLLSRQRQGCGSSSNGTSDTSSPVPSNSDARGEDPGDGIRSSSTLPTTQPPSAPPTPTGTGSSYESEDRGDLIKFYNTIYAPRVHDFALKFSVNGGQSENLTLSPLPIPKNQLMSPCRRVSDKHAVFVRSLEQKVGPSSPKQPVSYFFNRSPGKVLREINNMIQTYPKRVGKRLLADDEPDADAPPAKQQTAAARRLRDLIGERLGQTRE